MPENGNAPITKSEFLSALGEFEERLTKRLDERLEVRFAEQGPDLEQRLMNRIEEQGRDLEQRLMNRIEGRIDAAETRVLDAVHDHADAAEVRIQRVESSDALLTARLAILERRLLRVERRLDLGPEQ